MGPLHLVLHAVKFDPSSVQNHVNDLLPMMIVQAKAGKGIAFLKVDNDPDWCFISKQNIFLLSVVTLQGTQLIAT